MNESKFNHLYTTGSVNLSLGQKTRVSFTKRAGEDEVVGEGGIKARGNEMSEISTRFLTSMGILYGHIFHDEFPKNLKKYIVFIILILQKCQRKL